MSSSASVSVALRVVIFGGEALELESWAVGLSAAWERTATGEHVRDHGDDGACRRCGM